jgi:hypothetical protein
MFSQPDIDDLIGRWDYQDIYQNELIDSIGIQMLESFFGDMMLKFNANEEYKAVIFGRPDQGVWTTKNENTLLLRSNEGNIIPVEIISLTPTELVIKLERGEFVMKKTPTAEPIVAVNTALPFETVSATSSEITHRWNLKKKDYNQELSESAEEVAKNIQGSIYMVFNKNGKFESFLLGLKEKGSWKFSPDKKAIYTDIGGKIKIWNIISISETELVLIQGNKPEKWYFQIED